MSNLIHADFMRFLKDKIFLICTAGSFGCALYVVCLMHMSPEYNMPTDTMMFCNAIFIDVVIAVVVANFVGEDYRNGTIRNKSVVGYSRISIYFSNLIVCIITSLIIHIAWLAVFIVAEASGFTRKFEMTAKEAILSVVVSVLAVAALTSIFLLICMLITSKSAASVITIILSFIMLYTSSELVYSDNFLLSDVPPVCQLMQLYELVHSHLGEYYVSISSGFERLPYYSIAIIIVTTTAGIIVFQKKDLK